MSQDTRVNNFSKVKVYNIHCSHFLQASHHIGESYQAGEGLLLLHKSLLATPDNHLVLMFGSCFQD